MTHGTLKVIERGLKLVAKLLVASAFLVVPQGKAQQVTATLAGTVRDTSGAVVPEAGVNATNVNTGVRFRTISGSSGRYIFPSLAPGAYALSAEKQGFRTTVISGITLNVYQKATINIVLRVGNVTQQIEVKGSAPLVSSTSASVGTTIGEQPVVDLPLNLRRIGTLATLVPTTVDTTGRSQATGVGNGSGFQDNSYNAAGGRSSSNLVLIDGMMSIALNNGGFALQPVPEMVKEFKIQTNTYDAAYGLTSGSVMNVITQSGTNQYHGSAWEYLRNGQALDARNFFAVNQVNPVSGQEIPGSAVPPYIRNQFGFAVGGPIRKDKTFFFGSYEGLRLIQGQSATSVVPTPAQRTGDFSSFLTGQTMNLCGAGGPASLNFDTGQLFSPASESLFTCPAGSANAGSTVLAGQPILGNVVQNLNPVAQKVLALFPSPNRPGIPNFVNQTPDRRQDDIFDARVDETLSAKDQLFVRYMFGNTNQVFPGSLPAFSTFQHFRGQNAVLGWTHTFGPTLLNDVRIGFQRDYMFFSCQSCPRQRGLLASFGIENLSASVPQFEEYPFIVTNNFPAWGDYGYFPDVLPDQIATLEDTVTKTYGRQAITVGADLNSWQTRGVSDPVSLNGQLNFNGQYSSLAGEIPGVSTISDLADLELGYPSGGFYTQNAYISELSGGGWFSAFGQDNVQVTPRLALQLGLRWEYRKQPTDAHDRIATLYPLRDNFTAGDALLLTPLPDAANDALCAQAYFISATGQCLVMSSAMRRQLGLTGNALRELSFGAHGAFAPRIGVSWRPTNSDKLVIHSGVGIFYDLPVTNIIGSYVNNNPVFTKTPTYTPAFGSPPPLTNGAPTTTETLFASAASVPLSQITSQLMPPPPYFTPTTYEWSLTTESQLSQNWAVELGYVGNRGIHLDRIHLLGNQPVPGVGDLQPRRPWPDFNTMLFDTFDGISSYQAGTAKVTRRFASGFTMLGSYTYAKGLDDNGGDNQLVSLLQNDNNAMADYGVSDNSVTQRLVLSPVWQLPFGTGQAFLNRPGIVNYLGGGWELSGIVSFQSGFPFTVTSAQDFSNTGSTSPRPDRICNGAGSRTVAQFFNTSCFSTTALSAALANGTPRFGSAGRNILTGPGLDEWDVSLIKRNRITEQVGLEFRAEFFNIFNRPNFGVPNAVIGTSSAGQITGAGTPRDIQFGLKLDF
jgi:Carboxypeptidase regulatory-like domain